MEYRCERCGALKNAIAYQVTSEEFGMVMLDVIVCYDCFLDARRFGLNARQTNLCDVRAQSHFGVERQDLRRAA
jgi:hypothetical protein